MKPLKDETVHNNSILHSSRIRLLAALLFALCAFSPAFAQQLTVVSPTAASLTATRSNDAGNSKDANKKSEDKTVRKDAVEAQGKFVRQSGGRGQYGDVWLRVSQNEQGAGFEFINSIKGGVVPAEYITPVRKGIEEAMSNGVIAGYPVVDVKVELYDGSYHEVDSSEMAFTIAGSMGFQAAFKLASPTLLEPIMKVVVVTPEEFMGDVIGDLNSKRGRIESMEDLSSGVKEITAFVPLGEMFGYTTNLRSMTQGRASSSMELDHYADVPGNVAQEIIAKNSK